MSYVIAATDILSVASENLQNIGSELRDANAAAAAQTSAIAAPAADEVSAAITALFGTHAQEFRAASAQAEAFHNEFVNLLNGGAAQYVHTEIANAGQTLLNSIGTGQSIAGVAAADPAASKLWQEISNFVGNIATGQVGAAIWKAGVAIEAKVSGGAPLAFSWEEGAAVGVRTGAFIGGAIGGAIGGGVGLFAGPGGAVIGAEVGAEFGADIGAWVGGAAGAFTGAFGPNLHCR